MTSIEHYLGSRLKAKHIRVGDFVKMDNTTIVTFVVNGIDYELKLPKFETFTYYRDYFSRNYPELLL
jgi:hypothetical protein